jgi:predicted CXXCH cytochrome family protein
MGRKITPAGAVALAVFLAAASTAPATELNIIAPPDGSLHNRTPIILIGSGSTGTLAVTLNGRKVEGIKQSGRAFTGPLELARGSNVLLVTSGPETIQSVFEYQPAAPGTRPFRYHDPVVDGECKSCHPQGVGRTSPVTEAKLCSGCHDPKTGYKRLHGPLGTGQCTICHAPHGSSHPALLVSGLRALCVQCHAQARSQTHIAGADKLCPECHNPHGSEKKYLLH